MLPCFVLLLNPMWADVRKHVIYSNSIYYCLKQREMFLFSLDIFFLKFKTKHNLKCCFSAGVVLTLVIPAVSSGTGPGTLKSPLVPMGSAHGHTGHVRFLTTIELPEGFDMNFPPPTTDSTGFPASFEWSLVHLHKSFVFQLFHFQFYASLAAIFLCIKLYLLTFSLVSRQPVSEQQHTGQQPPKAWLRASQGLRPHPFKNQPSCHFWGRRLWGLQTHQ